MSAMQSADRRSAAGSPAILLQLADEPVKDFDSLYRSRTSCSSWSQRQTKSKHRGQLSTSSGPNGNMISPEEFEALPLSIQRKYFSQEERLHIAQRAAAQRRKRQPAKATWLSSSSSTNLRRPATSTGAHRPFLSHARSTGSEASVSTFNVDNITDEQARWFLTIPVKARRQQFSPEEQGSLMVRCKEIIEDTEAELAKEISAGSQQRCSSLSSLEFNFNFDFDVDSDDDLRADRLSEDERASARQDSFDSIGSEIDSMDMQATQHGPHVPADEAAPIPHLDGNKLNTIPPPPPIPVDSPSNFKPKRRTLSRALSLTPLPLPPPTLAPARPMTSSEKNRRLSLSGRMPRHFIGMTSSVPSPSPDTKFYQDADAREQLRKHLSPQKFDEAIEFGFASNGKRTPSPAAANQSYSVQDPRLSSDAGEIEDDASTSSLGTLSPRTPTASPDCHPTIKQTSFDSGIGLTMQSTTRPKTPHLRSLDGSVGSREMTIHMTLTRPELRVLTPGDGSSNLQRGDSLKNNDEAVDPLALESITVCDDPTGAHGAFAVHDDPRANGLKRVWKTIRRH